MHAATKTLLLTIALFACSTAFAQRYTVIIHEVMADPQPAVGLPDAEFIELKNRSAAPVQLNGWRLQTGTATSGPLPDYVLQPDSFVVVTSRTNAILFGTPTIGITSFPALSNGGTTLSLLNDTGALVHTIAYDKDWYGDETKAEGGWTLEIIDAATPCAGAANWKAATAAAGGTPGRPNSVQSINIDETPPALLSAVVQDSVTIILLFSEPVSITNASFQNSFRLAPAVSITSVEVLSPLLDKIKLSLQQPLQEATLYTITAQGLEDCAGNTIGRYNLTATGIPQPAAAGDVVINELLFNPKPDGADYVELYNRSDKVLDASLLRMKGSSNTIYTVSSGQVYLVPKSYVVLTEDRDAVLRQYLVKEERQLWKASSLPSLPDDAGTFILLDTTGAVIDAVKYDEDWHHALIADAEGVALERLNAAAPTGDKSNWTSAAATAGFGTPTYQNSQRTATGSTQALMTIKPKAFSPDGDGFDDVCSISFETVSTGWVANLRIFDAGGRQVRYLVKSQTLAQNNTWTWDGLDEQRKALPVGAYVLWLEVFNLKGEKQVFKKVVALARR